MIFSYTAISQKMLLNHKSNTINIAMKVRRYKTTEH